MIKIGTIGTSMITDRFLDACQTVEGVKVTHIYSRTLEKGQALAKKYQVENVVDQLDALLASELDLIYIASPNSLHYPHATSALEAGKHVIVEKPQFSNYQEWQAAHQLAASRGLFLFEAALHVHRPYYQEIQEIVYQASSYQEGHFLGANFHVGQYSSRYDQFLEAENQGIAVSNIFHPDFSGGSLKDMGVYPLYIAVALFGFPSSSMMYTIQGTNTIDLLDQIILDYGQFQVSIFVSKAVNSSRASEIYLGDQTLVIPSISLLDEYYLQDRKGTRLIEKQAIKQNPMIDEITYFTDLIKGKADITTDTYYENLSGQVCQLMENLSLNRIVINKGEDYGKNTLS